MVPGTRWPVASLNNSYLYFGIPPGNGPPPEASNRKVVALPKGPEQPASPGFTLMPPVGAPFTVTRNPGSGEQAGPPGKGGVVPGNTHPKEKAPPHRCRCAVAQKKRSPPRC